MSIGGRRLGDNSFLTHLATGRETLDNGFVREDVFTWTSAGEPVVVQSWLASTAYAIVDEVGGLSAIRALMAVTAGALAVLCWILTQRSGPGGCHGSRFFISGCDYGPNGLCCWVC